MQDDIACPTSQEDGPECRKLEDCSLETMGMASCVLFLFFEGGGRGSSLNCKFFFHRMSLCVADTSAAAADVVKKHQKAH